MSRHDRKPSGISRRSFIKGAGVAAVAGLGGLVTGDGAASDGPQAEGVAESLGPGAHVIDLNVNGRTRRLKIEPRVTLLRALREHLGLTGTKLVCDRGACGACTVLLDGKPVTSCMMLAIDGRGHRITTIEGLGSLSQMHPLQAAFVEADALQCGFCTPGMVMSLAAALKQNPALSMEEVKLSVAGNTCRCGTYPHVFKAALLAARKLAS